MSFLCAGFNIICFLGMLMYAQFLSVLLGLSSKGVSLFPGCRAKAARSRAKDISKSEKYAAQQVLNRVKS